MTQADLDVLVVGAGISGVSAGYHLRKYMPKARFAIFEGRHNLGGTWDLFKYPGIRSDSDMYTLGFRFRPWRDAKAIADAPSILKYLKGAVKDYKLEDKIRYQHRVEAADWDSDSGLWTVRVRVGGEGAKGQIKRFTTRFLYMCSGYYDYASGYRPNFPQEEAFDGTIVHPQKWPEDLDYRGKRVVVIGSGATAITIVPEMAKTAKHVTMLQRSPTYIVAMPSVDKLANALRRIMPSRLAYALIRSRNIIMGRLFFWLCRKYPEAMKRKFLGAAKERLPANMDMEKHFTPRYNPWEQRLCLAPDGDFFESITKGDASVVTDTIKRFTKNGIELESGESVEADIIVTATGLNMRFFGGTEVRVDGKAVHLGDTLSYKGMMFSGVPNLAQAMGYTNASWTLKCDLTAMYVCRLLRHMNRKGYAKCCPSTKDGMPELEPMMDFSSGYVTRAMEHMPKQGATAPWRMYQNYFIDKFVIGFGSVKDNAMEFTRLADRTPAPAEQTIAAE